MQDYRMDTFLEVCRYMNYTKAARALNLTQPAVSQHIHFLECEYGVKLFVQEGKKVELTEAGRLLQNTMLTFKHDEKNLREKMLQTKTGVEHYSFGATRTVAEFIIIDYVKKFLGSHPDCKMQMQVGNTAELLRKLDESEIDFAVVEGDFPRDKYSYLPFCEEEFIAAAVPDIAIKYKQADIQALLQEGLLIREQGSGSRVIFENWLEERGLGIADFAKVIEIGNIGAINELVKSGLGITFCYRAAITKEEQRGELVVIPVEGMHISHDIMFISRKDSAFQEDYVKIYYELTGKRTG